MPDKNKGGRPAHKPTDAQRKMVESMSAYGVPQMDISKVIGIERSTLQKHYREELDTATAKANSRVAQSLYNKALGDGSSAVTAAIFWLKTRGGWRETNNLNHVSEDGSMTPTQQHDLSSLTEEELADYERLANKTRLSTGMGAQE